MGSVTPVWRWSQRGWAIGSGVLCLMCLHTVAYGQRLTLTPSLALEERYDSNIFATRTNTQNDVVTVLSPGLRAQYMAPEPTQGTHVDFEYRADAEVFAEHTSQNQLAHRLSFLLQSPLAPSLDIRARDLLLITDEPFGREERLSDPTGLRPLSQQRRARTLRNEAEARLDLRPGARLALGVVFQHLLEEVDIPEEFDESRLTLGADLGYILNVARDSRLFVTYQVTSHRFRDNGVIRPGTTTATFRVHAPGLGWRHALTPTLAVQAILGYSRTDSDAPPNDAHKAFLAHLMLTKTLPGGEASVQYVRRFISGEARGGVVLADTLSGALTYSLTGKLTARVETTLSWFDFRTDTSGGVSLDQRFWSFRTSLQYHVLPRWRVSTAYAYETTHFVEDLLADRADHRLLLGTSYLLNEWLTLGLSYRYTTRRLHGDLALQGESTFQRHQAMLTLTASPPFHF